MLIYDTSVHFQDTTQHNTWVPEIWVYKDMPLHFHDTTQLDTYIYTRYLRLYTIRYNTIRLYTRLRSTYNMSIQVHDTT